MKYQKKTHVAMCKLTIICSISFALCFIIAMLFYPGGTQLDATVKGYSFFTNFFSDTGRITSYSGESNLISMVFFVIALICSSGCIFFFNLENIYFYTNEAKFKALRNIAGILGFLCTIAALFIPIFPEDINPSAHKIAALTFSILLLLMLIFYAIIIKIEGKFSSSLFRLNAIYVIFLILYVNLTMTNFFGFEENIFEENISILFSASGQKIGIIFGFYCVASLAYEMQKRITQ